MKIETILDVIVPEDAVEAALGGGEPASGGATYVCCASAPGILGT